MLSIADPVEENHPNVEGCKDSFLDMMAGMQD